MSHAYHPRSYVPGEEPERLVGGPEPILFDGCEECEERSRDVLRAPLDRDFMRALWQKMVMVEHHDAGRYRSDAEGRACHSLYEVAVFLEKHTAVNPWTLFPIPLEEAR